jgi:two-component system, sensor histidine kinase PdtaS
MAATADRSDATLGLARAMINASQQPMLLFDEDLHVVGANRSFSAAFDVPDDEADGRPLAQLGRGEWALPQLRLLLENARADGPEQGGYETDLVRPGVTARRLVVHVQNVDRGQTGAALILMTINDVTDARRIAEVNVSLLIEKDDLLKQRAVLLQEMQHRIANSLQIIASILMLKARAVKSTETRRHLRDAHDRVMSVAAVQRHLEESLGDVEVRPYLTKLGESLASSMIRESRPLRLEVRSDPATVSSHEAVSLGLIVTELVINALKHAFPDGRGGLIGVDYSGGPDGWVLSVADDGVGRPPGLMRGKPGLGTTVIEALARQLDAQVSVCDGSPGTRVALAHAKVPAAHHGQANAGGALVDG